MTETLFDHEGLDAYRLAINYVASPDFLANLSKTLIKYEYRDAEYEYEVDRNVQSLRTNW